MKIWLKRIWYALSRSPRLVTIGSVFPGFDVVGDRITGAMYYRDNESRLLFPMGER